MKLVREVVREMSGHAPYEKRILELLKLGKEKRALKFAKLRVWCIYLRTFVILHLSPYLMEYSFYHLTLC